MVESSGFVDLGGRLFSEGAEIDAAVYLNDLAADLIIYGP